MLRRFSELRGTVIQAKDGDAGFVDDLYFNADSWVVRHIGVAVAEAPFGRLAALPSAFVLRVRPGGLLPRAVRIDLTRQQLQDLPDVARDPLTAGRVRLGAPEDLGRRGPFSPQSGALASSQAAAVEEIREQELLSGAAVSRYRTTAQDGGVGRVKDLVYDDRTWRICYLVVAPRKWWPRKGVLIDVRDVGAVDAAGRRVRLKLIRDEIRRAREYDPHMPLLW